MISQETLYPTHQNKTKPQRGLKFQIINILTLRSWALVGANPKMSIWSLAIIAEPGYEESLRVDDNYSTGANLQELLDVNVIA